MAYGFFGLKLLRATVVSWVFSLFLRVSSERNRCVQFYPLTGLDTILSVEYTFILLQTRLDSRETVFFMHFSSKSIIFRDGIVSHLVRSIDFTKKQTTQRNGILHMFFHFPSFLFSVVLFPFLSHYRMCCRLSLQLIVVRRSY